MENKLAREPSFVTQINIEQLFEKQVRPALGCTEIVAVSLATSVAYKALFGNIPKFINSPNTLQNKESPILSSRNVTAIELEVDRNVFKNAARVNIPLPENVQPGKGMELGAVMGLFCDSDHCVNGEILTLYKDLNESTVNQAREKHSHTPVLIKIVDSNKDGDVRVRAKVYAIVNGQESFGEALILGGHTTLVQICNDREILYESQDNTNLNELKDSDLEILSKLNLSEIIALCKQLPDSVTQLIKKGVQMNLELAEKGIIGQYGFKLGRSLKELSDKGYTSNDILTKIKIYTAAACDARMGGAMLPAMSTAGSGNQGIVATLPIIIMAKESNISEDRLVSSLALSHLITSYAAFYSGELTASCGCGIKAGIGATAGIAYCLSGDEKTVGIAINNFASTLPGMVCDGAKGGCAFKASTAVSVATESALLAVNGIAVSDDGIVNTNPLETIKNIGILTKNMVTADWAIINHIMSKKYEGDK